MAKASSSTDKSPEEVEELVKELAREGNSPSEIGLILRDQYGVPSVKEATGKKMSEILKSIGESPEVPEDLMSLLSKAVDLHDHLERNPRDSRTKRSLEELESRIHELTKYYKKKGRLPEAWRYSPAAAELLVRE
ncbi:30S ribosomal protein S15 [candidate division MSBL1 archaeon SCGC-AAA261G05]|uniref:30S ribosomal protein S15 n=2 Tax=candidate division MSBL1 TaxID=215777 RepID=A0A133V2B3_9EURY|nr:30S ribosomal protein S15 [candidate division MSBL1 archaeon SCGC-AAA261C02]KXB03486.1 30S ribosomal protein S15 [candidate division MSBL1 archaeon SCGC-AAA261G05]